jgi:hypothetical protein
MSEQGIGATTPAGARPSGDGSQALFPIPRSWKIATVVAMVMVLLALLGVGLTTSSSSAASSVYWISLVPVYGFLCIGTAWSRSRHGGVFDRPLVLRQLFHWLGIGVALSLDFYIRGTGEESGMGAGLNALLLLALGCYLAGVHLDWLFAPVGVLLSLALIILTKADQYLWVIFVVGILSVVGMVFLMRLLTVAHARRHAAAGTAHSVPAGS